MESRMISTARETNNYKAFWCAEKVRNAMLRFELKHGRKPAVAMMGLADRKSTRLNSSHASKSRMPSSA